jgi:predicted ATPase/DNA-binding CsgD family transcriptional regulator
MLVTSRRALRLSGEQEFALSPLPVAKPHAGQSLEALAHAPAVALFVDRAVAANPAFQMTSDNAQAVIEICTRLDGLPLAIELAAARIKMLSPQALASRLTGRLQLLTSGPRDAPQRQQTLRQTIGWSFDLLTPYEQILFRRLAVFAGGASLDAAEAVAGHGAPFSQLDILDGIAALVDQSLLVRDESPDGEPRFRMLETIREFALEGLEAAGEEEAIRDAHAAFFIAQAELTAVNEYGPDETPRVMRLEPDLDNVRAALHWLLTGREFDSPRAHLGLRLAGAMVRFWDMRGYLREERGWLAQALAMVPDEPTPERGTALTALGVNSWFLNQIDDSALWTQQALDIWRVLDDRKAIVRSLWFLGLVAAKRQDIDWLQRLHEESAPLTPSLDITLWKAVPEALLGMAALARGDGQVAMELFTENLKYHEQHRYYWPRAWVLGIMGEAAMLMDDRGRSLELFQASLAQFNDTGDLYAVLDGLIAVAVHMIAYGDGQDATPLLSVVERLRASIGHRTTWTQVSEEEAVRMAKSAIGEIEFAEARKRSETMQLPEAVALALAYIPGTAPKPAEGAGNDYGLSPRELEVLRCLTEGMGNQEIGEQLFISTRTAGTHVSNILAKLGVHSRAAAVAVALNDGLV